MASKSILSAINRVALPLTFSSDDYDALLGWIGDCALVLIGEASHGTRDFTASVLITTRLIKEKGFNAVAIEGDWPDASRGPSLVHGASDDTDARDSLGDFLRLPGVDVAEHRCLGTH